MLKIKSANTIWWRQSGCKEEWIPDTITRSGWYVKIKSIQGEELAVRCVVSLINFWKQNWDAVVSVFKPS